METVVYHDKRFRLMISYEQLSQAMDRIAARINSDYSGNSTPVTFICVLNGAIMFTAEMMKRLNCDAELISLKMSSYCGTSSQGTVKVPLGLTGNVEGRDVIVFEDIVDSGLTMVELKRILKEKGARDVKVCTMLLKPDALKADIKLDYVAMEIPNDFIVGFGLDYDELGRNLKDIYVLDK